jgi:hypothetical protein
MAFRIGEAAKRRCWEDLQVEQAKRTANLRARLEALVAEHGLDSLYADMLAGMNEREAAQ